jgi:hypothetical protein
MTAMPRAIQGRFGSAPGVQDLGIVGEAEETTEIELTGEVGSETGAATVFYDFETAVPSRVAVLPRELNRWESPLIQWFIRRLDDEAVGMDEDLEMSTRPRQGEGSPSRLIQPGRYRLTAGTQSWYRLSYVAVLRIRPEEKLRPNLPIELLLLPRLSQSTLPHDQELGLRVEVSITKTPSGGVVLTDDYASESYWEDGYSVYRGIIAPTEVGLVVELETVSPIID